MNANEIRNARKNISANIETIKEEMHKIMQALDEINTGYDLEHDTEKTAEAGNERITTSMIRMVELQKQLIQLQSDYANLTAQFKA